MKLYTATVHESIRRPDGVFVNIRSADAVDVQGRLYADSCGDGSFLVSASDGWHETESAAREDAAQKISSLALLLIAQAERVRNGGY